MIAKCGESINCEVGVKYVFAPGSYTRDPKGRLWCVIQQFACMQGLGGLIDENGNPIDILDYAIRVANRAAKQRINHLLRNEDNKRTPKG